MRASIILVLFMMASLSFSLHARKPAVEDFVGVETENHQNNPEGTEVLFNFGNHLDNVQIQADNTTITTTSSNGNGSFALVGLLMFICLPFLVWLGINKSIQEPNHTPTAQTPPSSQEQPDNVASLDKYRESEKEAEETKKAS